MKDACRMARQADIDWSRKTFRWNEIVDDLGAFDFAKKDKQIKKIVVLMDQRILLLIEMELCYL